MGRFNAGEKAWIELLGNLRNIVRQDLIRRQLAEHATAHMRVLDVGCGQGTQAIHLARRGCAVLGVDPSVELLQRLAVDAQHAGVAVETRIGTMEDLPGVVGGRTFDLVCAHGVLMYLSDIRSALEMLAARVGADGMLSVTFRNAAALAFRPGMRGRWQDALDAMEAWSYTNELGLQASAQSLDEVREALAGFGLVERAWYGVRVFTDPLPPDQEPPLEPELQRLLDAEYQASRRDPYRHLGSQIHLIAERESNTGSGQRSTD